MDLILKMLDIFVSKYEEKPDELIIGKEDYLNLCILDVVNYKTINIFGIIFGMVITISIKDYLIIIKKGKKEVEL